MWFDMYIYISKELSGRCTNVPQQKHPVPRPLGYLVVKCICLHQLGVILAG